MSQNYKFKSLQIAKASQEDKDLKGSVENIKVYEIAETRTIDFVMLDGTRQNFPYSHYLTSWLGMENEERIIKIFFATHLVTIRGFCLGELYEFILTQRLKAVTAHSKRYNSPSKNEVLVTEIIVKWKKENQEI